jgi:transcriptional regulator with GAF, ATPase, and Fis domain
MILHRDEIIAACETELQASERASSLAQYLMQHFDSIVKALEQDSALVPAQLSERAVPSPALLGESSAIARVRLGIEQRSRRSPAPESGAVFHLPRTGIDFAQLERELLTQALAIAGSNQTRAASLLGLTRDQLRYRLAKFDITVPSVRSS